MVCDCSRGGLLLAFIWFGFFWVALDIVELVDLLCGCYYGLYGFCSLWIVAALVG